MNEEKAQGRNYSYILTTNKLDLGRSKRKMIRRMMCTVTSVHAKFGVSAAKIKRGKHPKCGTYTMHIINKIHNGHNCIHYIRSCKKNDFRYLNMHE